MIYFDNGNPKKDKIPEYKLSGPNDEFPIWRDHIILDDFKTALKKTDITAKFTEQLKKLFDAMGKYGIDFYNDAKEKKEIEEEDAKKENREKTS